jgi:hypothetical protein
VTAVSIIGGDVEFLPEVCITANIMIRYGLIIYMAKTTSCYEKFFLE